MQVYIVAGGIQNNPDGTLKNWLASTETLRKDGGSAWQLVASLPSKISSLRGLGVDNGRFLITGELRIGQL